MVVRGRGGGAGIERGLDMDLTDDDTLDNYRYIHCEEIESFDAFNSFYIRGGSSLKILHLNIRSYYKNFDSFLVFLEGIKTKLDIIVLSEAWIDSDKKITLLQGYNHYCTTENWNRNDGLVIYVKLEISAECTEITLGQASGLVLDFNLRGRHYNLVSTYRSPSMDIKSFLTDLADLYRTATNNTTCIFAGDINIDIHANANNNEKDQYLDILYSAGLIMCIDKYTRVTDNTKTCLDHIFIKHNDYSDVSSAILQTDITDHYIVTVKINNTNSGQPLQYDLSNTYTDARMLNRLMQSQSWDEVLARYDVNSSCELFFNIFNNLKSLAMKRKYNSSRYKKIKPWITFELVKNIRKRDKLSKILKRQPFNVNLKEYYNNFRNQLSKDIKQAKVDYYKKQIAESNGKPKLFWNIINEFSGISKGKNIFPIKHFLRGSDTTGGAVGEVADSFNDFFSQVGCKLASELLPPSAGPPVVDDAAHATSLVLELVPVTTDQVRRCVQEMRGGSAPGIDNISTTTIKNNLEFIVLPLTHIVNLSITTGVFPTAFKTAKVVPVYKSSDKSCLNNYRPISLLSGLSKVLEKCVKEQLHTFLETNNLISDRQFGFRKGRNAADALYLLNKEVTGLINANKKCLILYIDLAKAFDSIDRELLFTKLECLGLRGNSLKWFKSYLNNRRQVVSICNQISVEKSVDYGVVQGSTLGPLLFLVYINNLDKLKISGKLFLFADDTAVIFKGDSWEEVFQTASFDLAAIKLWFDQNILTMNVSKTKFLPIALRTGSEPPVNLKLTLHSCGNVTNVCCDCQSIERVDHYKYLGVIVDAKLKYDQHINYLKSRLRRLIFPFTQLSLILDEKETKMAYCAFVQSILQYGIIAYGGAHKTFIDPLSVVQKSILKAGLQKNRRYPSNLLFQETSILTVRQLFIKAICVYTFSNKDLVITPTAHNYLTRNAQNIGVQVPKVMKAANYNNSYYIANYLYRNLPVHIRDAEVSVNAFKRLVTNWLLQIGTQHAEALMTSVYSTT